MDKSPAKILIVEDERSMAEAMATKLTEAGFATEIAEHGKAALEHIETQRYDLILLDILMPAMDGIEFMKEIIKREIEIPIIVASNLSREEEMDEAKRLGAVAYFIKSETSLAQVVDMVKKLLSDY